MKFIALVAVLVVLALGSANGGFIKLAQEGHLISVSLAPISPSVGEKQAALISFVYNNSLIKEKVDAKVEVKKAGKIISSESKSFAGGVAGFDFVYPEEGIYEVFVEFSKESQPQRVFAPEDFLVQVKNGGGGFSLAELLIAAAAGFAAGGFVLARVLKK